MDEQYRRQEAQLRARLDQLEKESEQHQAVLDALNRKYTDAIEKLQNDKVRLEVRDTLCSLGMGLDMLKITFHTDGFLAHCSGDFYSDLVC